MCIRDSLEGIASVYLTADDVVRHRLVKEIIKAYQRVDDLAHEEKLRKKEERKQFQEDRAMRRKDRDEKEE